MRSSPNSFSPDSDSPSLRIYRTPTNRKRSVRLSLELLELLDSVAHIPVDATSWKQTVLLRFQARRWSTGNCVFLGQLSSADLPPEVITLRLA